MGYYTRVLTTAEDCVSIAALQDALKERECSAVIQPNVDVSSDNWEQITLVHPDGVEIAVIERNVVKKGSLAEEELKEFSEALEDMSPRSAAQWLQQFFSGVRCIYAFQHLSGTERGDGFASLSTVRTAIWAAAPSVLQADGEGFSNEDGYHITWDFADSVTGDWWMGILCDGKWSHFQMDLGNPQHRKAFKDGKIPNGVKRA